MVAELAEANLKQIIEMYLDDDTECSEENEIIFIATSRYYGAAGNKKKQKELDKIIKAYDDYIDDKMMNDCLDGDGDADYDFLWYKSVATPSEESLRVQKM